MVEKKNPLPQHLPNFLWKKATATTFETTKNKTCEFFPFNFITTATTNKYITNIHCNLWSKPDDITEMLDYYKQQHKNDSVSNEASLISFDDLYQNYKSYIQAKVVVEKSFHPNVSKQFFEKFLSYYLATYIKFDKFVSSDWIQS